MSVENACEAENLLQHGLIDIPQGLVAGVKMAATDANATGRLRRKKKKKKKVKIRMTKVRLVIHFLCPHLNCEQAEDDPG